MGMRCTVLTTSPFPPALSPDIPVFCLSSWSISSLPIPANFLPFSASLSLFLSLSPPTFCFNQPLLLCSTSLPFSLLPLPSSSSSSSFSSSSSSSSCRRVGSFFSAIYSLHRGHWKKRRIPGRGHVTRVEKRRENLLPAALSTSSLLTSLPPPTPPSPLTL